MVTVIQRHCAGIKSLENVTLRYQDNKDHVQNIIYSDGMIAQQNTSGVISDPNECSHSSARKKQIKTTTNYNQQQWRWYDAIVLGQEQTLHDYMARSNNEEKNYNNDLNFINDIIIQIVKIIY